MNILIEELGKLEKFKEYEKSLLSKTSPIELSGLSGVGKIELVEATKQYADKNILFVTYNEIQAKKIVEDLKYFSENVLYFPKREIAPYDYDTRNKDLPYERIETLNKIYEILKSSTDQKCDRYIIVTTIEALMQKMISREDLYSKVLEFKVGLTYDLEELKKELITLGYERANIVDGKGQFSIRGGIVDIGTSNSKGIRIEFWGDDVDSIRTFNITSQRSNNMLQEAIIYPSNEFILTDSIQNVCKEIEKRKIYDEEDIEILKNNGFFAKIDKYFNSFYKTQSKFLEYIPKDFLLCIDDISKINKRQDNIINDNNQLIKSLIEKDRIVPDSIDNINKISLENEADRQIVFLEETDVLSQSANQKLSANVYNFKYRDVHFYKSEINILLNEVKDSIDKKTKIIILAGNEAGCKKIGKLLEQEEITYKYIEYLKDDSKDKIYKNSPKEDYYKNQIIISTGVLSSGYRNYDLNLLVITGEEFLAVEKKRIRKNDSYSQGEKIVFADLEMGDYVVHKTQGIGQYIGVNTITTENVTKDYIKIKYRNDDVLYVPTDMLDNVRKYIGTGDIAPKLNKLGSKEWENTKRKVKSNLKEVAKDLIELYAKRQNSKGYAFSKDTPWQKQFEDDFPYTETDDQLRCIAEVKKDMEAQKPMDRLLCGDVGYGKTEVAIRAAFKAVMDQKQVAYLVPTTILANQQYEEFKERMGEFAVNVELLNRFRTKKEQDEVIKKLKLGEVDVVIGTHRILSKDVEFKDLGLLIIDEEHRFGVKDKEKIKKIKENVDVLTMTATPIPRTLHMSIVGIRDMSVIYEPPHNRKPVQTYVLEYDAEVIKEAITKELERGGQVFYLFNNVETIQKKADEISRLVPEAQVGFAHGKMTGNEIEEIMEDFIGKKINVLVCTTILESGIDIPNANTIIVENADRLGLAQLYQIRGRVGRSDRQGYAYITYKRDKLLSEVADKRLKAIREFTEFGSGFKIAMRDLEIRGAGSILGEVQHGHMEQVGYETYCKLLDEVIKEMQGVEVKEEKEIQIDLDISSYIPETYIEDGKQKIEVYQDIALAREDADIEDVIDEITDRFGTIPEEVLNLIEIARIKILARKTGIIKIAQKQKSVMFFIDTEKFNLDGEKIDKLIQIYGSRLRFSPGVVSYITLKITDVSDSKLLKEIEEFIDKMI